MLTKCKSAVLILVATLAFASTGCMVTPNESDLIKTRSTPIDFTGWTTLPNQTVKIYAKDLNDQWKQIGTTKSGTKKYRLYDQDWYYWNTKLSIPAPYWDEDATYFPAFATVKAIAGDRELLTWDRDFYDYVGQYDSLEDLYDAHGNGAEVHIISAE